MFNPFRLKSLNASTIHRKTLYITNVAKRSKIEPFCTARYIAEYTLTYRKVKIRMTYGHNEYTKYTITFISEYTT